MTKQMPHHRAARQRDRIVNIGGALIRRTGNGDQVKITYREHGTSLDDNPQQECFDLIDGAVTFCNRKNLHWT